MAMSNPATQQRAEPLEGDNLTGPQAAFLLAVLQADPDAALAAAGETYEAAGYSDAESFVDDTITFLSSEAGEEEPDDLEGEDGEEMPEED